jgi:hypothetical protein
VRPPDGRAAALIGIVVRAGRSAAVLLAGLSLAAAGCGDDEPLAPQVPGPPSSFALPEDADSTGGGNADADADAEPTATPTPEGGAAAPSDQSGTAPATGTGGGGATADADGGGATAPAQEDSPQNDSPPPAGSEAEQFEDFCAQNPGAC